MSVTLLTENYLEFLSLKEGCTCLTESTLVKVPHCWKSHVTAHMYNYQTVYVQLTNCIYIIQLLCHSIATWFEMSRSLVKQTEGGTSRGRG